MSSEHERDESVGHAMTASTVIDPQLEKGIVRPGTDSPRGKSEVEYDSSDPERTPLPGEDWDTDPENPRNWTVLQKWIAVSIVSLYTFITPLGSTMMAPALPAVALKYNIQNDTLVALTLSIFLLSFAIGPLVMAPLSEIYGRTWVLHISNLFTLGFNIGCAYSPNLTAFILFRLLCGFSASCPISIGGGSVSDCFSPRDRAAAMAVYTMGPLIAPVVGPIAGGFITQGVGLKWVFLVISIVTGVVQILAIPLKETYGPVVLLRKLRRLGEDPEQSVQLRAWLEEKRNKRRFLWNNISRPVILLTRSFICFVLSLYMALIYGIYYLMFSTFPDLFSKTYHWGIGVGGLAYIGLGIGFSISTILSARLGAQVYRHLADKNGGQGTPEMRVPAMIFSSFFVPVGLFWYGWSAQAKIHWIMPIIGTGIFGFGQLGSFLATQLYLVDAFQYAASAIAAAAVFRSLLAFAFPLFGAQMYKAMGQGGGNSMLAGLAIVLGIPFPIWLYYRGEQLRATDRFARH